MQAMTPSFKNSAPILSFLVFLLGRWHEYEENLHGDPFIIHEGFFPYLSSSLFNVVLGIKS